MLLEADLGVGVDPVAQADERRVRLLEQLARALLRVGPVHLVLVLSCTRGQFASVGGPEACGEVVAGSGPRQYGALTAQSTP